MNTTLDAKSRFNAHIGVAGMAFKSGDYHAALRNLYCAEHEVEFGGFILTENEHANMQHLFGKVYTALEMYPEAEKSFNKSIQIRKAQEGDIQHKPCTDMRHLAHVYRLNGKPSQAEQLYKDCITELGKIDAPKALAKAYMGLGQLYVDEKSFDQAEQCLYKALDIFERNVGSKNFWYGRCLMVIARLRYLQDDMSESEKLLRQAIAILELIIGPHHPLRAKGLKGLSQLLMSEGKEDAAHQAFADVVEIEKYLRQHDI